MHWTDNHLEVAIEKARSTSVAYSAWQSAIALHNEFTKRGYGTVPEVKRIESLIDHWQDQWAKEVATIGVKVPDDLIDQLEGLEAMVEKYSK